MRKRKQQINSTSIPDIIKELWSQGFFISARDPGEIKEKISSTGYNFSLSSISVSLMRLVRSSTFITRTKVGKRWKYIQKTPNDSPVDKRSKLFFRYELHPQIKSVAYKQFQDGYFKEAIQNALVEVIDQVRIRAERPTNGNGQELDGDALMNRVFGCDNQEPIIKLNALSSSLDKAEQRGLMNLYKGIVGIRDRKAHLNFIQNDPLKTMEYLSLASLLMRLLEEHEVS